MQETCTKGMQEQVQLSREGVPLRIVQGTNDTILTNDICAKENLL